MRNTRRRRGLAALVVLAGVLSAAARPATPGVEPGGSGVGLNRDDRVLVLAPHPDDETLGCAGIIQKAVRLGIPVRVVIATYGDDNEWSFLVYRKRPVIGPAAVKKMAMVRDREARRAVDRLGLGADHVIFLGYPDHALESIWKYRWSDRRAGVGPLSRSRQVPYADAFRPGAPYKGEEVVRDLRAVIRDFRPTKIFLSHPADRHPDHRSVYLFTQVALWEEEDGSARPELFPYLVHFHDWPDRRGGYERRELTPPSVLRDSVVWASEELDPGEISRKFEALKEHRTQYESGGSSLRRFVRPNELFGDFPKLVPGPDGGGEAGSVTIDRGRLLITVRVPSPVRESAGFEICAFGYRRDVPFGQMPKLRVVLHERRYRVYEKDRKISPTVVRVHKAGRVITLALPLQVINDPQRLFLGASAASFGEKPDYFFWRTVVLPPHAQWESSGRLPSP